MLLWAVAIFTTAIITPAQVLQSHAFQYAQKYIPFIQSLGPESVLLLLGMLMVALVFLKNALRAVTQYAYLRFLADVTGNLSKMMLDGIMRMPYEWLLRENSANLLTKIQFAANSGTFLSNIFLAVSEAALLLIMFLYLITFHPLLTIICVAILGIPAYLTVRWMRRRLDHISIMAREHRRSSLKHAMVAIQGIKDVKLYGKEAAFGRLFEVDAFAFPMLQAKQEMLANFPGWLLETFGFVMLFCTMFFMYFILHSPAASVTSTLAMLAVFTWRGLPATIRVVTSVTKFRTTLPYVQESLEQMELIHKWAQQDTDWAGNNIPLVMNEGLALDAISFQYKDSVSKVVDKVSFSIAKGQTIGIVGESGAGKSTLMNILIGLLRPTEGIIRLDGTPLGDDDLRCLRMQFGYVPQSPYILDASLAENVAFGVELTSIDMERLKHVCSQAGVEAFLNDLPEGYLTVIGERGVRLSGGQQQRICIARALYNRPSILLFDEATSSLDSKSERLIQDTIASLKGSVTMIIVAHRLSTVESCDRIVWIQDGRVKSFGTAESILHEYRRALQSEPDLVPGDI